MPVHVVYSASGKSKRFVRCGTNIRTTKKAEREYHKQSAILVQNTLKGTEEWLEKLEAKKVMETLTAFEQNMEKSVRAFVELRKQRQSS
jgi:hypothetical protein